MKRFIILLIYFIFIFKIQGFKLNEQNEKDVPVFQPFPAATVDAIGSCSDGVTSSIQLFNLQDRLFTALSITTCGIQIYEFTDVENPVLIYANVLENGKTNGLTYVKNQQLLWASNSNGDFYGIDVSKLPFQIKLKSQSNQKLLITKILAWNLNENILLLLCNNQIQVFDWRQQNLAPLFLKSIPLNGVNVKKIQFFRQNQYLAATIPAKGIQFYSVSDGSDIDKMSFLYSCVVKPYFFDAKDFVIIDEITIAIVLQYKNIYLTDMSQFFQDQGKICTQTSFKVISASPDLGLAGNLYLSQNRRYIYAQFRAIGTLIYDISSKQFEVVQLIKVTEACKDIILNDQEDLLFYTNSLTLQVFKKTQHNFNRDIPNLLLNTYQSSFYNWFKKDSFDSQDNLCIWREKQQEVVIARGSYGALNAKYSGNGILEENSQIYNKNQNVSTQDIQFLPDGVTAYLTRQSAGISIVDFSNPKSPQILKENLTLNASFIFFNFLIFFDNYKKAAVSNIINILILSIEDPLNPVIIGVLDSFAYSKGETASARMAITSNFKILVTSINLYGVLVADVSDPTKPKFLSKLFTDGVGESRILSDNKHCLIASTYRGLFITQITENGELDVISIVKVFGTVFRIFIVSNERYVIATSYENPAISLISIVDLKNPKVIQRIGKSNIQIYAYICLSSDESQFFVTAQDGLYFLQIQSQIILHTQIYQLIGLKNSNNYTRKILNKGVNLRVGQLLEMHLVPIYQTLGLVIQKAYYYDEYILQDLPQWMLFIPTEKILKLNISKDSLKKNNNGEYISTVQQVVFVAYQAVQSYLFINDYLGITKDDSDAIFQKCIKFGVIDNNGFIQDQYSSTTEISFGIDEQALLQKWTPEKQQLVKRFIQYSINQNIINYTTQFRIENSLVVDFQNKQEPIQSIQNEIQIFLSAVQKLESNILTLTNQFKFVDKNYSGVLVLLSDRQDEIKIQGSLKNVNKILSDGIKYSFEQGAQEENLFINLKVSDGVNYDFEQIKAYDQLNFLSKQSQIFLSKTSTLQSEFNDKFPGGKIYVQESFQYQIGPKIFESSDVQQLRYIAQIQQKGEFVDIPRTHWLQFSVTERIFSGTPLLNDYNDVITIQVNVTDGYTFQTQYFTLQASLIPFSYFIYLLIQILGPILGILGLNKYKYLFYNLFFKQKYTYSKEIAYVGEIYKKQITITNNNRSVAFKLWKQFLNSVGQNSLKEQLIQQINQNNIKKSLEKSINNTTNQSFQKNVNQNEIGQFEMEIFKKYYKHGVHKKDLLTIDKNLFKRVQKCLSIRDEFLKINDDCQNNQTNQNQNDKKNQQISINMNNKQQSENEQNKSLIMRSQKSTIFSQKNYKIENNKNKYSMIRIFNDDGKINFEIILNFLIDEQKKLPEKKRIVNDQELRQLSNKNSVISSAIYCFLVEYLINLDLTTKKIFESLQKLATKYYNELDWYKAYLDIQPSFQDVNIHPYPDISINQNSLNAGLLEIFNQACQYQLEQLTQNLFYSQFLIEENIKSKALGFSQTPLSFLQQTSGEAIHTYSIMIHSVQAYEKNSSIMCCFSFYKKLDLDYKQMGLIDNNKLPTWIHGVDLINGTILFGGVPEKKDIGKILIKVINQENYILRSFEIDIIESQIESSQKIQQAQTLDCQFEPLSSIINPQHTQKMKNMRQSFIRQIQNNDSFQSMKTQNCETNVSLNLQNQRSLSNSFINQQISPINERLSFNLLSIQNPEYAKINSGDVKRNSVNFNEDAQLLAKSNNQELSTIIENFDYILDKSEHKRTEKDNSDTDLNKNAKIKGIKRLEQPLEDDDSVLSIQE